MLNDKPTYISLFSSAGVGCYGFKQEDFECIATVELIERRLDVQRTNGVCRYESGYIAGDIKAVDTKNLIHEEINRWSLEHGVREVDVVIATPPCQGISVANHKKKNELARNSLVIESLSLIKDYRPKFFIVENVRGFLKAICTDNDGQQKTVSEALYDNLGSEYSFHAEVMNFKDYGSPSSRTRTLIVGVRKDIEHVSPLELFPRKSPERTLRDVIGTLDPLPNMGDISPTDILHNFRPFEERMLTWIKDLGEGQSAFENSDPAKVPHRLVNGSMVTNQNKNSDKYRRCYWDKVAPCVHTRNDILASQSTIHPRDNRVFSIRELMLMMSIPENFLWFPEQNDSNALPLIAKVKLLKKHEVNIRQSIGEAVPTVIFKQIAQNIRKTTPEFGDKEIKQTINSYQLEDIAKLVRFIETNPLKLNVSALSRIAELSNNKRTDNAAYYTNQRLCSSLVKELPGFEGSDELHILEPSVGVGNFLPLLFRKYEQIKSVTLDLVDIDPNSLRILKALLGQYSVPSNFTINFIQDDFLTHKFKKPYDLVIGNPPFKKLTGNPQLLRAYKKEALNSNTNNLFAFFAEKAMRLGKIVALISPKSLLSAPEFDLTRSHIAGFAIRNIIDHGEKGFKGVKIETLSWVVDTSVKPTKGSYVVVSSDIFGSRTSIPQSYICDPGLPYWLIYRNGFFDRVLANLHLGIFDVYRDRKLSNNNTSTSGAKLVLKARNIANGSIVKDPESRYVDPEIYGEQRKAIGSKPALIAPNLSYYPRAAFYDKSYAVDGSAAVLIRKNGHPTIEKSDLEYFASQEFFYFYRIARNFGTRSLNIDKNSAFFWGVRKTKTPYEPLPQENRSSLLHRRITELATLAS